MLHCPHFFSPNLCQNSHMEPPLPLFLMCDTTGVLRNSAITTTSPLIRKSTLRWTLWSSHNSSVAKRQQLSCPLSTVTLSLKFENMVPCYWIVLSINTSANFFIFLLHRWEVLLHVYLYEYFSKNLHDIRTFFSYLYNTKTQRFCPHFFGFWGTSQADCGVGGINPWARGHGEL